MMPDREKVVKGIEMHIYKKFCSENGNDCPYYSNHSESRSCVSEMLIDALALLKEQQEQIDKLLEESASNAEMAEGMKELLKEQDPVPAELEGGGSSWWWVCGECHGQISKGDRYCRHCGHEIKWE